jgi:polyhydroxyalkanoate synthesis regulator phasin
MTMSVETKKVLDMLAEGKITSEDAERLLDKLAAEKEPAENSVLETQEGSAGTQPRKYLRILVNGEGKDVNVRVPLSFVRSGVGLMAVLPPRVADKLHDKGFDLSALKDLKGDELNEALNTLNINIDSSDGKHVRIFCE